MLSTFKRYIKSYWFVHFSTKGFHQSEHELKAKYYSEDSKTIELKSTEIVFMVDGRFIHGGLTDRLRGITSLYHYCKERGIQYYLNYSYPFELAQFLEPNKYNWLINKSCITYNSNQAIPIVINDWQFDVRLHKSYLDKIISKNKGKQIHIYSNTPYFKNSFKQDFKELFRPSSIVQHRVNETIQMIGEPYIAMVFRFQQLLGDFKETGYKTLPEKEQNLLIQHCINKVNELRNNRHCDKLVLVTSDSSTFLQTICQKLDFVRIIPGKVVHMDHTSDASNEVYMKSFVDLFVLSKAEKIYLLQTGNMYHSGFAKYASMVEETSYEEIIF